MEGMRQDVVIMMMSDNTGVGPRDARMDSTIPMLARDAAKDNETVQQPFAQTDTQIEQHDFAERHRPAEQNGSAEQQDPAEKYESAEQHGSTNSTPRANIAAHNDSFGRPPQATLLRRASSDTNRTTQEIYRRLSLRPTENDNAPTLTAAQLDEQREYRQQAATTLFTGGSAHFASGPLRARSPEQEDETPVSPTSRAGAWLELPEIPAFRRDEPPRPSFALARNRTDTAPDRHLSLAGIANAALSPREEVGRRLSDLPLDRTAPPWGFPIVTSPGGRSLASSSRHARSESAQAPLSPEIGETRWHCELGTQQFRMPEDGHGSPSWVNLMSREPSPETSALGQTTASTETNASAETTAPAETSMPPRSFYTVSTGGLTVAESEQQRRQTQAENELDSGEPPTDTRLRTVERGIQRYRVAYDRNGLTAWDNAARSTDEHTSSLEEEQRHFSSDGSMVSQAAHRSSRQERVLSPDDLPHIRQWEAGNEPTTAHVHEERQGRSRTRNGSSPSSSHVEEESRSRFRACDSSPSESSYVVGPLELDDDAPQTPINLNVRSLENPPSGMMHTVAGGSKQYCTTPSRDPRPRVVSDVRVRTQNASPTTGMSPDVGRIRQWTESLSGPQLDGLTSAEVPESPMRRKTDVPFNRMDLQAIVPAQQDEKPVAGEMPEAQALTPREAPKSSASIYANGDETAPRLRAASSRLESHAELQAFIERTVTLMSAVEPGTMNMESVPNAEAAAHPPPHAARFIVGSDSTAAPTPSVMSDDSNEGLAAEAAAAGRSSRHQRLQLGHLDVPSVSPTDRGSAVQSPLPMTNLDAVVVDGLQPPVMEDEECEELAAAAAAEQGRGRHRQVPFPQLHVPSVSPTSPSPEPRSPARTADTDAIANERSASPVPSPSTGASQPITRPPRRRSVPDGALPNRPPPSIVVDLTPDQVELVSDSNCHRPATRPHAANISNRPALHRNSDESHIGHRRATGILNHVYCPPPPEGRALSGKQQQAAELLKLLTGERAPGGPNRLQATEPRNPERLSYFPAFVPNSGPPSEPSRVSTPELPPSTQSSIRRHLRGFRVSDLWAFRRNTVSPADSPMQVVSPPRTPAQSAVGPVSPAPDTDLAADDDPPVSLFPSPPQQPTLRSGLIFGTVAPVNGADRRASRAQSPSRLGDGLANIVHDVENAEDDVSSDDQQSGGISLPPSEAPDAQYSDSVGWYGSGAQSSSRAHRLRDE